MRTSRQSIFVVVAALPLIFATACGDEGGGGGAACGTGTSLEDGVCVPDEVITIVCGDNTVEQNGECVPVTNLCESGQVYVDGECRDEVVCAPGTEEVDGECVAEDCPDGQIRDEDGTCRDEQGCGMGTVDLNGDCVPEDDLCSDGEVWIGGMCRPERGCGTGTIDVDGTCEVINPLDLADVLEGPESNDLILGGTPTPFILSDTLDDPIYLSGVIEAPRDFDGDADTIEGDVDSWVFDGVAGDRLRIEGTAVGIPSVGFFLSYVDDPSQGYLRLAIPLGSRNAVREVVLPFTGEYELAVGDAYEIFIELLPFGEPDGADDFTYLIAVTPIASPDFIENDTGAFVESGDLQDLDQYHIDLPAGELVQLSIEMDNLDADGLYWPSTVDHLNFPFGQFLAGLHPVPDGGLLVNTDFQFTLARDTGYTLTAERRPVTVIDPIASDIDLDGETIDSGGERYYRFATNGDIVLTAQATATDGGDVVVLIFDSNLEFLGASQNPDDFSIPDQRSVTMALGAGTYFVQIVEDVFDDVPDDETTYLFDLDVTSVPLPALGDGLVSLATPTISAADLSGLDNVDDQIFLRFDVGDYGEAALTADPGADLDVNLNFFDRRLLAVGGEFLPADEADDNGADGDESVTRLVPPVQHYVRLSAIATDTANSLSVDVAFTVPQNLIVETEDNDTPSEVDPLGALTATTLGAAMFQVEKGGEDIDFWSFELTSPAVVSLETIQLGGEAVDTFMLLYNSSLDLIDLNDDIDFGGGNLYSRLSGVLLDTGIYLVEIDQLDIVGIDEATDRDFYLLDVTLDEVLACFPSQSQCVANEVDVCSEDGSSVTRLACASGVCDDVAGDCQAVAEADDTANGDPTTAQDIAVASDGRALVDGALDAAGDSDFYAFTLGGESIVTTFLEQIGDTPADAVLHLYAVPGGGAAALDDGAFPGCNTVDTPDDCIGFDDTFARPQIGPDLLPAGDYLVRVSGFSGTEVGTYRLVIQVEAPDCVTGEQTCADATLLDYCLGGVVTQTACLLGCAADACGALTIAGASLADVDMEVGPNSYTFAASSGDVVAITVTPTGTLDPRFYLCDFGDAGCTMFGTNLGDNLGAAGTDGDAGEIDALDWVVPGDGVYTINIEPWFSPVGTYDVDFAVSSSCSVDDNVCSTDTATLCVAPNLIDISCPEGCDTDFCGPFTAVYTDTGFIDADNLIDIYGFSVAAGVTIEFSAIPSEELDGRIFVCPADGENPGDPAPPCSYGFGNNLGQGDGLAANEEDAVEVTFDVAGNYYVAYESWVGFGDGDGPYALTITPDNLPANTPGPETAIDLGVIDDDRFIVFSTIDDLGEARDADWFLFTLSGESLTRIETFAVAGSDVDDTEIWLYPLAIDDSAYPGCGPDPDNCLDNNDDNFDPGFFSRITTVLSAGDYLVRIEYTTLFGLDPGQTGPYRLEIETTPLLCTPDAVACVDGDVSLCDGTGQSETIVVCNSGDCDNFALGAGCAGLSEDSDGDNESFATAEDLGTLPVGRTVVDGAIEPGSDEDWFLFALAGPADVQIQTAESLLVDPSVTVDTRIELRAEDGTTVIESDDDDGEGLYSLIARPLDGIGYVVRVRSFGSSGDYRLIFDVGEPLACFPDGQSCNAGDVDVCLGDGSGVDFTITCTASDCSDQAFGSDCLGTEDPETGDTSGDATPLTLSEGRTVVRGAIDFLDEDWFLITLSGPSLVTIETASRLDLDPVVTADTTLELFQDDGTTSIDSDDDGGFGLYSLLEVALDAGDYYVQVAEFSSGDYRLIFDVTALACLPDANRCAENTVALCDSEGASESFTTCALGACNDELNGSGCDYIAEDAAATVALDDNQNLGSLGAGVTAIEAELDTADRDDDFFQFRLNQDATVTIETMPSLIAAAGDLDDTEIWIYSTDDLATVIDNDDDAGQGLFSLLPDLSLPAGSYVLRVEYFSPLSPIDTGPYRVEINVETVPLSPPVNLIISEVVDATLPDGLPKFVELTNTGTTAIDLSEFSIGNFSNGGLALGGGVSTVLSGTLAAGDSYVISYEAGDSAGVGTFFDTYGFDPDNFDLGAFINGDDVIALFRGAATGDGSDAEIIDVFGVIGVDGTGESWEYVDSYAVRNSPLTTANPTFDAFEWNFPGANALETGDDVEELALILANTTPGTHTFDGP